MLDGSASPVLINHSNELYCDGPMQTKQWPQSYEEVQLKEPEPVYAAHGVDMNTYDSVAHDENVGCDGNTKDQVHVADNTPLYSLHKETPENEMHVLKIGPKVMAVCINCIFQSKCHVSKCQQM